ncbi:hypothetical protein JCM10449v2_005396 [Rhodotorula kratochvilovae]
MHPDTRSDRLVAGIDRYTATLSASSRVPSTSTASLSASTLAPLRSSQALTTPRTRRVTPSSAATTSKPLDESKKPPSPSTVRPRSRIVSSASTASAQSLSRNLSRSTSSALDSPRTVRPSRTLPKAPAGDTTPRKKPAVGLGRPPQAGNETPRSARRSSGSTARSVSAASASSRTPLRSSSRAAPLSVSQTAMRPPPPPSIAASSRTLGTSRRAAVPGSAIPVPGARALRRPESALSTASSNAPPGSETSLRSAAGSALRRPTPRTTAAVGGVRRASNASSRPSSRASQAGAAPQIALSPPPGAGAALPPLDASAYATPRKPASAVDALSPEYATPAADLSTLSHFSHASFLSPLPPPTSSSAPSTSDLGASLSATPKPKQLTLLRPRARARPRESASLEELLRSGLLPGSSPAASSAGGGEGADEWELLLDEGSSRLMREEIFAGGDGGAPPAPAGQGQGQGTPWRGRVVSLGMSARRRSVASPGSPADRALLSPPRHDGTPAQTQGEDRVLLLRQSTSEASALRRQLAALQGEVALLRSARAAGEEERDARAAALERELDAARAREDEAREEWEAERREMEEEMAELASVVAAPAAAPVQGVDPARVAALEARQRALELDLGAERAVAARTAAAQAYRTVEGGARRERAEIKGELAALRALQQGLGLWAV